MPHRLLLIDDPKGNLSALLSRESGLCWQQTTWDSFLPEQLHHYAAHLVVAVATSQFDQAMRFFQWLREHPMSTPLLAVVSSEAQPDLLRTASEISDDFILLPFHLEEWRHRLTRLLGAREENETESVRNNLSEQMGLAQIVGDDSAFLGTIKRIPLIAASDAPVLVIGETGTGKELCARAIHHLSKRRNLPFIPVACAAIPDLLFENELFGHSRGAFTDAAGDQKGLVAIAEEGTLFLDDMDALSLAAQAKLLRFLEDQSYKPLGAERYLRANVKVISATNRDLESAVREGSFRSDLYFRLNVLHLNLPPLRERSGDIPVLAHYFLKSLCASPDGPQKSFSPSALNKLQSYDWPGNVRELFNVVQRAIVFSDGTQILPFHLSIRLAIDRSPTPEASFREARSKVIETFERKYVGELLARCNGNITRAAREAGKDRRTLGRLIKKLNMNPRTLQPLGDF